MDTPWLTICSTAPFTASGVSAERPSMTNPRCATDEYAIRRLRSCCAMHIKDPYTIPTTPSAAMAGAYCSAAAGKSGIA